MLKTALATLFIVSCLISLNVAAQQDAIGFVKTVGGDATVSTAGEIVKAQPGVPIYLGSILKTRDEGSLGVTFKDNTVMSFGPDTEVTIDEYLYTPAKGDLKLVTRIAKGTLQYISGVIAKLKPEAVAVKTPTGIIGVRGTHFLVKAEEE